MCSKSSNEIKATKEIKMYFFKATATDVRYLAKKVSSQGV